MSQIKLTSDFVYVPFLGNNYLLKNLGMAVMLA